MKTRFTNQSLGIKFNSKVANKTSTFMQKTTEGDYFISFLREATNLDTRGLSLQDIRAKKVKPLVTTRRVSQHRVQTSIRLSGEAVAALKDLLNCYEDTYGL